MSFAHGTRAEEDTPPPPLAPTVDDEHRLGVARRLSYVAADLDRRGYSYAGAVRQGARLLLDLDTPPPEADGCVGCGQELEQPAKGRRRKWCSEACRTRTRRR